jgi:hypothetical protein
LPGVGEARGIGALNGVGWPTSDPIPQNDAAREFVESVQGLTGGWKEVTTVVPTRNPNVFSDPLAGIGLIQGDLAEACGALAWITNQGICNSLDAKLSAAAQSLGGGQVGAARGSLRAFLQELEAQHGDEVGKHVDDNAYALLRVNVEYLLSILPRPSLPTVLAALVPIPGKSLKYNKGHFTVEYSCQGGTVTSATLNGWPVAVGDVANLDLKSKKPKSDRKTGKKSKKPGKSLKLEDTSFELEVTCANEFGATVVTASPVFPEKGGDGPDD